MTIQSYFNIHYILYWLVGITLNSVIYCVIYQIKNNHFSHLHKIPETWFEWYNDTNITNIAAFRQEDAYVYFKSRNLADIAWHTGVGGDMIAVFRDNISIRSNCWMNIWCHYRSHWGNLCTKIGFDSKRIIFISIVTIVGTGPRSMDILVQCISIILVWYWQLFCLA